MTDRVRLIDTALIEETRRRAEASPRRRTNYNFHSGPEDNPHRFLNVFLRGSYVAPHRHAAPPKSETFLVLDGLLAAWSFDDSGAVTGRWLLGPAAPATAAGIDFAPGVWHTVTAVTPSAVCFEVKPGPWEPSTDKEFASWAPREGDADAATWLEARLAEVAQHVPKS